MTPELVALLIAVIIGVPLVLLFDRDAAGSRIGGEAILIGAGACWAILFALSVAHIRWSPLSFGVGALFVAGTASVILLLRGRAMAPRVEAGGSRAIAVAFHALTGLLIIGYTTFATLAPLWEFDFVGDFGMKARAFWEARSIDWNFLINQNPLSRSFHADYPQLLPFAFDLFAIMRNGWNDQAMGLINVAFAIALLLVIHRLALEETRSRVAAAFVTTAIVPFAASPWIGLADGPLVAYATTGLLLIRRGSLTPGAVMLGLAASTKNEGLTFLLAAAIALAVVRRWREIPRLWPAIAIPLPWLVLCLLNGFRTDFATGDTIARVFKHLSDARLLEAMSQHPPGKPFFWIGSLAGLLIAGPAIMRRERFLLTTLALQLGFYIIAYLATPLDIAGHVRWSWERLIYHLTALLTYILLVTLLQIGTGIPRATRLRVPTGSRLDD